MLRQLLFHGRRALLILPFVATLPASVECLCTALTAGVVTPVSEWTDQALLEVSICVEKVSKLRQAFGACGSRLSPQTH